MIKFDYIFNFNTCHWILYHKLNDFSLRLYCFLNFVTLLFEKYFSHATYIVYFTFHQFLPNPLHLLTHPTLCSFCSFLSFKQTKTGRKKEETRNTCKHAHTHKKVKIKTSKTLTKQKSTKTSKMKQMSIKIPLRFCVSQLFLGRGCWYTQWNSFGEELISPLPKVSITDSFLAVVASCVLYSLSNV